MASVVGDRALIGQVGSAVGGDGFQIEPFELFPVLRRWCDACGPEFRVGGLGVGQAGIFDEPVVMDAVGGAMLQDGGAKGVHIGRWTGIWGF